MRAEQILDAVVSAVTGLTTTGSNVIRGKTDDLASTQVPGLAVYMGPDVLEDEVSNVFYDWMLTVAIESQAQSPSVQVDEILNTIRAEVHAALMSDDTLGLNFVIQIKPLAAGEPVLNGDGNQVIGTQRLEYEVQYRTSRTDLN
jgi:hypothetical protein